MGRHKVIFISCLILFITACAPPESSSPVTPRQSSTPTSTATKTATATETIPELTETPRSSLTPTPDIVQGRNEMAYHVIQPGDTIRGIAENYQLAESSIIHSNFEILPHALAPGMALVIPPIDGFYYIMKESEDLPEVAHQFGVSIISILTWAENGLDQEIEEIEPGKIIFIPGGKNNHFDWSTPTPPLETKTPSP